MFRPAVTLILLSLALSACANTTPTSQPMPTPAPIAKPVPKPAPFDPLTTMNDVPGVTVYPLNTPPSDPFTRKNLQPLSSKVIGEGYFVDDPSVNVYPPRLPQAIPTVPPMQGVRVDAASALYSGKIRAQEPPKTVLVPSAPAGQPVDDMSGGVIAEQPLPPVIGDRQMQADAPQQWGGMGNSLPPVQEKVIPAAPAFAPGPAPSSQGGWGSQPSLLASPQQAFTPAGFKSGPVQTGYGSPPPIATPTGTSVKDMVANSYDNIPPAPSYAPPEPGPALQPPTTFLKSMPGTPAPSLPAAPQGQVGQASLPSLTGY